MVKSGGWSEVLTGQVVAAGLGVVAGQVVAAGQGVVASQGIVTGQRVLSARDQNVIGWSESGG
jgi:hypothetical protein